MSLVDQALAEIDAALASMAPAHEGLRDYSRLNLEPEAAQVVADALHQYDRRFAALTAAREGLMGLIGDGYPDLTIPPITETALRDLQANEVTVRLALGQFTSNASASLGLSSETPEMK